jgi:hypothetical protein
MPSNAVSNFGIRLGEIEQLLEAHTALIRLQRADDALQAGGTSLANIAAVVSHLVTDPGPGRPKQVQALNKAAIALLSGHLQGFIADIYGEAAEALLDGRVKSVAAFIKAAPTRGNPNLENITKLFATLGFEDILAGMSWQGFSNQRLKSRLADFNKLRNEIVHGKSTSVTKDLVNSYLDSWIVFADRLDQRLRSNIRAITGDYPW